MFYLGKKGVASIMESMTLLLKNDITELEKLSQFLEEYCEENGIGNEVLFKTNLALDEIVTNIISYGYSDGLEHEILLTFTLNEKKWIITVIDDGLPFNPLELSPPDLNKSLDDREIGGLGIHFVLKVMEVVEYQWHEGRNVLSMQKAI